MLQTLHIKSRKTYPHQPLQQQRLMLVIPQDALLMNVKDLFPTQTAFSATRLAKKKSNKQADGQQNKYPDLNMLGCYISPSCRGTKRF